ncbi:ABC transporter permease [Parapedobacter koreensis]|uniref:ABC transport system permease protein n=1 Tax=Parapedobacter koreensis TaxID=332977 RepID=A0A1H7QZY8_9SPHI|nr:hypothetical protein [Parapedobacter koreensis]SEL53234.1 hypothetical protein SAMN05421740_106186 [Parapedobacter koreensis]
MGWLLFSLSGFLRPSMGNKVRGPSLFDNARHLFRYKISSVSAMNKWLEDFAYRIEIQWWVFAIAGVVAVAIALLTVSWQAIRAALANPVESLRDE